MQIGLKRLAMVCGLGFAPLLVASPALPNPVLVIDADSGKTLIERQATANWYPASLTKLMTTYVALKAVRDGRLTLDTPIVVSARAASMPPSKMGFRPGVQVTMENALKMLMVKSPNDIAVTVAEGVSGSVEAFADEMNASAARLGLKESHFVNPNGLPDDRQVSSARDMAMIGRALIKEFPEYNYLFGIGALRLGDQIIRTHNGLIGRYPGADGMKTGFTCAAGFNVVASATQNGRRLIAVVLGSPSARDRTAEAAALFDKGFSQGGGLFSQWSGGGPVEKLPSPGVGAAPDMRREICSRRGRSEIAAGEEEELSAPMAAHFDARVGGARVTPTTALSATISPLALAMMPAARTDPVPVFVGPKPGWTGPVLAAREPDRAPAGAASAPTPSQLTAYAPADKAATVDPNETPALTAPIALHSAVPVGVKPPAAAKAPAPPKPAPKAALAKIDQDQAKPKTALKPEAGKPAAKPPAKPALTP